MTKKQRQAAIAFLTAMLLALSACGNVNDPGDASLQTSLSTPEISTTAPTDVSETTPDVGTTEPTSDIVTTESQTEDSATESSELTEDPADQSPQEVTAPSETEPITEIATEATTTEAPVTTTEASTTTTQAPVTSPTEEQTTAPAQPSPSTILTPTADGTDTVENELGVIDYSNAQDGYVMVKYTGDASRAKVQVTDPGGVTQTYNLNTDGNYEVFPFSGGSGSYSVLLAENISGTTYAVAGKATVKVSLTSDLAPFLRPNQYVNYKKGDAAVKKASELCAGADTELEKVDAVYSWLVDNVTYDKELAANLGSGYLPDTDKTVNKKIGICLDYAGTMAAMLRSQNVPTKLIVGYAGSAYHAWISVYCKGVGWVYTMIYFDGSSWHRLDPTFAASSGSSDAIMKYIGDGSNYSVKYVY